VVDDRPLPTVLGLAEHHAEGDVGVGVPVVVDVDAVDGIGMKRRRDPERVGVENQHGARRVGRRLEGEEIGEVEARIFGGWSEPKAGEVIRHAVLLTKPRRAPGGAIAGGGQSLGWTGKCGTRP
jgi:hypothetical protein